MVEKLHGTSNKKTLKGNCLTRWLEKFHAIADYIELFDGVVASLEEIESWTDNDVSHSATALKLSILQSENIVTMVVLQKVFGILYPLTK